MAQFEFVSWLVQWLLSQDSFGFDWDEGNATKSAKKHGIEMNSAEQVFMNREFLVPLGVQISPTVNEPRFGALGMDFQGNRFFVCFTIREGLIRIISIRTMSQAERKRYGALREE